MIGRKKAERLAALVRKAEPKLAVECGTAIGYSGLWIARELKAAGGGKLVTVEINPDRAKEAEANFRRAGLEEYVTVKVGDARKVVKGIEGPIDFVLLDCGYSNYLACLEGMQARLAPGAVLVADNVGIGEGGMTDYLDEVRSRCDSKKEWFDLDLPWANRDAIEVSVLPEGTTFRVPFERPLSKIADSLKSSIPEPVRMFQPLRVGASKERDHYRMYIMFTFQGEEDPSLRLRMECRLLDRRGQTAAREVLVSRDPRITAREAPSELGIKPEPISSLEVDIPKDAIDEHKLEHIEFVIAREAAK
jgi:predicted O-methyltransferase YrrM